MEERTALRSAQWAVLLCLLLTLAGAQVSASSAQVLVVIPAQGMATWDPVVEEVAAQLKAARQSLGVDVSHLPILRLSSSNEQHARVLKSLKLREGPQIQVLLCSRGEGGWPNEFLRSAPQDENLLTFVRSVLRPEESPPASETTVADQAVIANSAKETGPGSALGLLLLYDKSRDTGLVKPFLSELGRHWMERYGRVEPPPYPLAYYDIADGTVRTRLQASFPELTTDGKAAVALCFFSDGRPVRVLEVHQELELPATLVRQLSSARTRHLAESLNTGSQTTSTLPTAEAMQLSDAQETSVLLSRIHELAQQLWSGSSEDESPENRLARRNLLNIIELTRSSDARSRELSTQLKEALADYQAEALILSKDSSLEAVQTRFIELTSALLEERE